MKTKSRPPLTIPDIALRLQKLKNIEKRHGFSCPHITRRLLSEIKRMEEENMDHEVMAVLSKYAPQTSELTPDKRA